MAKFGLEPPIFAEKDNSFLVTINEKLATAELTIMGYLDAHPHDQQQASAQDHLHHRRLENQEVFREMENKKMIKQVEATRTSNTRYRKWMPEDDHRA